MRDGYILLGKGNRIVMDGGTGIRGSVGEKEEWELRDGIWEETANIKDRLKVIWQSTTVEAY